LADFQAHLDELRARDGRAGPPRVPGRLGLRIPEDADRIGALYEIKRNIIQPSEFLLGPDRRVLHATYSSGPIGRIAADDVVKLVGFLEARAQARA